MASNTEIVSEYESLIKNASELYLDKQYPKALISYYDALNLATTSKMSKMIICILKYMVCCCLYESNRLDDLAEAVMVLQTMDRTIKNRFPAVYCLLAQTHCKLFRFELAEMEFRNADAIFSRNSTLETYYIPGTEVPIRPTSKDDEIWLKIKEECLAYHKPDAMCSFPDCNYVAKPYVIPNKNIFLKDPAFNGMVIVNCNNKDQPCVLKFHQSCWKMKKDELFPLTKVSDKDILRENCFTPNCLNGDDACVIVSIQIIDQKGDVKAHIKENPSNTWPVKSQDKNDKNTSKATAKKTKVDPAPKKSDNSSSNINNLQKLLLESIAESKKNKSPVVKDINSDGDIQYYDESQMIVVKDTFVDVGFPDDSQEVATQKSFLLSVFFDYIKNYDVTIGDVYSKFNEFNQDLHLKDFDILGFLIHTNNFKILSNQDTAAPATVKHTEDVVSQPVESSTAKSSDDNATYVEDVYSELVDEMDEIFVDDTEDIEPTENYNFEVQNPNFHEKLMDSQNQYTVNNHNSFDHGAGGGSGDASENLMNSVNSSTPQSLETCAKFDSKPIPLDPAQEDEYRKLQDYIAKLENAIEEKIVENFDLRKEIANKTFDLESVKKEQEMYEEQMKLYKETFEKMKNTEKEYDDLMKEKVEIEQELVQLMKEKNELEEKLKQLEDPEVLRAEVMKVIQDEDKSLKEALTEEWKGKTDVLKNNLKKEIEVKMTLLNKLLNAQYSTNKHVLTGYLNQCSDFVEVTNNINRWMEKTINVNNFSDNSAWLHRFELLQNTANHLQSEYSKLLKELNTDRAEKFKMTDINLPTSLIPNPPKENLSDVILKALNVYYKHQSLIMQNHVFQAQQAATQLRMQSPIPPPINNSVQAGYMQQPIMPCPPPMVPLIPMVGMNPMPTFQATTGPPPNLTLQHAPPMTKAPIPSSGPTITPEPKVEVEKLKPISSEPTKPIKDVDVLGIKEKINSDVKVIKSVDVDAEVAKDRNENKIKGTEKESLADFRREMERRQAFLDKIMMEKELVEKKKSADVEQKEIEKTSEKTVVEFEQKEVKKVTEKLADIKIVNQVEDTAENIVPTTKTETITQAQSTKDSVSVRDDRSDVTALTLRNFTSQKKLGMDGLVKIVLKKFPGAMELDVNNAIAKIRRDNNNSLTGLTVKQIIEDAKPHIQQSQSLHVIRYFDRKNGENQ